jgi:hypothetical protein
LGEFFIKKRLVITEVWEAGNTSPQEHSIITSWLSAGTIRVFGALGSKAG